MDDQTTPLAPAGDPASGGAPARPAAKPAKPAKSTARFIREIVETLLLALVIYLGVRTVVLPYEVEGKSMSPNLFDDERLMVNRVSYVHYDSNDLWNLLPWEDREGEHVVYPFGQPDRGDIIVFDPPTSSDKSYVKRVIGLPGETITFRDGYVYVDGQRLDEEYIDGPITGCERPNQRFCEVTVPDGHVYVLGDNRNKSSDSREFGVVDIDDIIGEAVFANWPLDAVGPLPNVDYGE